MGAVCLAGQPTTSHTTHMTVSTWPNVHVLVITGNTSSKPEEEEEVSRSTSAIASGASIYEVCSVLPHSAECGNEIRVQSGVWQKWKDFHDHFEYYLFRVRLFHYVICIRRRDTHATLAIDLVVQKPTSKPKADSKWYIRVREAEWKPGNRDISTSKHKWHAAAALKAVHMFSPKFGDWTAIANNCKTWVKGVVGFMGDDDKRGQCDCSPITDDFDHLRSFGESIGVELTYLSSKEAKQPLPQPEGDEEMAPGEGEDPSNQEFKADEENVPGEKRNTTGAEGERQEMKVISEHGEEVTNTTEVQGDEQSREEIGNERKEERGDSKIEDSNNKEQLNSCDGLM